MHFDEFQLRLIRKACSRQRLITNELVVRYGINVNAQSMTNRDEYEITFTEGPYGDQMPIDDSGENLVGHLQSKCTSDRIKLDISKIKDEFEKIQLDLHHQVPVTVPTISMDADEPVSQICPKTSYYNLGLFSVKLDEDQTSVMITTLQVKWEIMCSAAKDLACQVAQHAHQILILQRLIDVILSLKEAASWLERIYQDLELHTLKQRCDEWFLTPTSALASSPYSIVFSGGEDEQYEMESVAGFSTDYVGFSFEHRLQFTTELRKLNHVSNKYQMDEDHDWLYLLNNSSLFSRAPVDYVSCQCRLALLFIQQLQSNNRHF